MTMRKPDLSMLAPYLAAKYELIPLHKPDAASVRNGVNRKDGKRPLDPSWTTRPYDAKAVAKRCASEGRNVGVRLRADQLVIDVDPRNFEDGKDSFKALCADLRLNPSAWPRVVTGSGGDHYYLLKPADVPVIDSLEGYPGVEFKSKGRQVVAAGSAHPETGKLYEFDFLAPGLSEATEAPDGLLGLIRRPERGAATGGGQYTQEQVAAMLDALEAADFGDHDKWLTLMMACHHASNGDARDEFLEWSSRDPAYADRRFENGRRWDSLHSDAGARVTYRTLNKFVIDAGHEALIPRAAPDEDFMGTEEEVKADFLDKGVPDETAPSGDPTERLIDGMNLRYCAVIDGGKLKVFEDDLDETFDPPRRVWTKLSRDAFLQWHENKPAGAQDRRKGLTEAEFWLTHPRRREYRGIGMYPEGTPEGKLNLWRGWSIEPEPGDWSLMRELIVDVLCAGNEKHGDYVLKWIAFMLQKPGVSPESALVFRGDEGVGKGTLGRALMRIAGVHGMTVASPSQFAGRFNAHLRDCVFLFADEAFWPGHKDAEGALKQLITEPHISYELKGVDATLGRNLVHLLMASNKDWVVPAGLTARRFAMFNVSDARRNDRAWFGKLKRQMDDGGLAAMMHDLLGMKLGGWHPASAVPQTKALGEQKFASLGLSPERFYIEMLQNELIPAAPIIDDDTGFEAERPTWEQAEQVILASELTEAYRDWLRKNGSKASTTSSALGRKLARFGVERCIVGSGAKQRRGWKLPKLRDAMRMVAKALGHDPFEQPTEAPLD